MTSLWQDLKFAIRGMRRSPLFASVAILSLALGIGANTAIFTLMDQLMLRMLPIKAPEQLVMIYQKGAHNGSNMGSRMHSYPIYQDFQKKAEPFSEVLARRIVATSISVDNQTERVQAEMVSGNYFTMLGVKPALGRVFTPEEDDRQYRGHPSVVLGYDYWVTRFGGDKGVIGKKILVNNYPMNIVGVSAPGFTGLDPASSPQIRVPLQMKPVVVPEWPWVYLDDRRTRWVQVFARLKPGYTVESSQAPLQGLFKQIREYETTLPAANKWSPYARAEFLRGTIHVEQAATGYSSLRNSFSKALIVLMCMVGLVLLITCANVANLMIARALARQKEIAVRLSLGASRGQLVRQLLVESLTLSLLGGVLGVFIATTLTKGLLSLVPVEGSPLLLRAEPDLRILGFTMLVTFFTGLLFGLVPALQASRPDLWSTLKDAVGSIAGSGTSLFFRKGLVTAQVALSFLLLFGSGLFVRSLQNLKATDTGMRDIDRLITFRVSPALSGYDNPRAVNFYSQLLDQMRTIPGVKSAAFASVPLLSGDEWDSSIRVEGYNEKDGEDMQAFMNSLSPGYFDTMGIALLEGRDFEPRDVKENAKVTIVNQKFAKHYFGSKSAVGRHIGRGGSKDTKLDTEIIGVVADSLYEGPREGVRRQAFIPHWGKIGVTYYVRSSIPPDALYNSVRSEVRKLDSSMPVYELKTLGMELDQTLLTERLVALLSAGFGLLATLLAAIGLYGVMAFVVARRTKEVGVRMALGAQPSSVIWLVMREVFLLVGIGLVVAVPTALYLGKHVEAQLYGIKAADPWIAGVSMIFLIAVASLAGFIPAHKASRIDPILALRYD
jgi:predicted permease